MFYSIQYKNDCVAASNLPHLFIQSIKFIITYIRCLKSVIHQLYSKNHWFPVDTGCKLNVHKTFRRRPGRLLNVLCIFNLRPVSTGLLLSASFTTKFGLVSILTLENAFSWRFRFKANRKSIGSSKKRY